MKTIKFIMIMLLVPTLAFAVPSQADTDNANTEFDTKETIQKNAEGKYDQVAPVTTGAITHEVHVYEGPSGVGYIHIATKTEGGDTYMMQRHVGPETDRNIVTTWTLVEEAI